MIKLMFAFLFGLMIGIIIKPNSEKSTIEYTINKNDYFYRLRSIKLFLQNQLRELNIYFGSEHEQDEMGLINSIPRYEYQIKEIDNILTNYGKIKEIKNDNNININ